MWEILWCLTRLMRAWGAIVLLVFHQGEGDAGELASQDDQGLC
ncbi:MAG: hypothetical protein ACJAZ5_002829, partial [Alloalcanivorax venustensis]